MREFVRKNVLIFSEGNANIAYATAQTLTHLVKDWTNRPVSEEKLGLIRETFAHCDGSSVII